MYMGLRHSRVEKVSVGIGVGREEILPKVGMGDNVGNGVKVGLKVALREGLEVGVKVGKPRKVGENEGVKVDRS